MKREEEIKGQMKGRERKGKNYGKREVGSKRGKMKERNTERVKDIRGRKKQIKPDLEK